MIDWIKNILSRWVGSHKKPEAKPRTELEVLLGSPDCTDKGLTHSPKFTESYMYCSRCDKVLRILR